MAHYYSEEQDSPKRITPVTVRIKGLTLEFESVSGTFSIGRLDFGTAVLIENAIMQPEWSVLDLGCGWGAVGVVFAKLGHAVTMTDVNRRAVEFARRNCEKNKVKARIFQSNGFEKIKESFDTVLFNPPHTAGKDVCFSLIEGAYSHINSGGVLQLVARHNKGGKTLAQKMEAVFGNVTDIVKKGGFRVYVSKKQ